MLKKQLFLTLWAKKNWDKFWSKWRVVNNNPLTSKEIDDFKQFLIDLVAEDEEILQTVRSAGFQKIEQRVVPRYEDLIQKALFETDIPKRLRYLDEAKLWNVFFSTLEEIPQEQTEAVLRYEELKTLEPIYERS